MKKNIIIAVLSVISVLCVLSAIGAMAAADDESNHSYQCWQQADKLVTQGNQLWAIVVEYQNAGYQVDDYTAGSVNSQVANLNTAVTAYNSNCASSGSGTTAPIRQT